MLWTAQLAPRKRKMLTNIRNWQMLDALQSLRTTQISIMLRECQNESGVCNDCSLSPAVDSLNVTRHIRIYSIPFEGGLGPTKLNLVPSIFVLPQHLRLKLPKSRTHLEERCRKQWKKKQWKETPQTSRSKKVPEKKTLIEEHSVFERANTPCNASNLFARARLV